MVPLLETPRLGLRALRDDDLDAYAAMVGDPQVVRYLGDGNILDRGEAWRHLAMLVGHWELRGYGMWAVTLRGTDAMIGRVGLFNPEGWPGFEIGWTIARSSWGKGYATEAACRARDYAFDVLHRPDAISVIHPENAASIRVAEKIGARLDRRELVRGAERLIYRVMASR
jgi:RimJ/RimL family protein N-acetyltransferase